MSIERRLEALEQTRQDPPPERKPQDLEALVRWYVEQFNFAKAAEVSGISETEALAQWGDDYRTLMKTVKKQQQECEAYCQAKNAKPPKKQEEVKPTLPLPVGRHGLPASISPADRSRQGDRQPGPLTPLRRRQIERYHGQAKSSRNQ